MTSSSTLSMLDARFEHSTAWAVRVTSFSVRAWLAEQIGCAPDDLAILDATPDERTILFARGGEPYGEVHVLAADGDVPDAQGIAAAWLPGDSANAVIPPGSRITW